MKPLKKYPFVFSSLLYSPPDKERLIGIVRVNFLFSNEAEKDRNVETGYIPSQASILRGI